MLDVFIATVILSRKLYVVRKQVQNVSVFSFADGGTAEGGAVARVGGRSHPGPKNAASFGVFVFCSQIMSVYMLLIFDGLYVVDMAALNFQALPKAGCGILYSRLFLQTIFQNKTRLIKNSGNAFHVQCGHSATYHTNLES